MYTDTCALLQEIANTMSEADLKTLKAALRKQQDGSKDANFLEVQLPPGMPSKYDCAHSSIPAERKYKWDHSVSLAILHHTLCLECYLHPHDPEGKLALSCCVASHHRVHQAWFMRTSRLLC